MESPILDQITESQVSEWMLAKLESLRENDKAFTSISIEARQYKCMSESETTVSIHADEKCVIHEPDITTAINAIRRELYGGTERRAAALRKEADAILQKASELDRYSETSDGPPNNRPQDGKVCDCEDAPCCGHYES